MNINAIHKHYLAPAKGYYIRCSSHWSGSPQDGLGDERTCGMTLASAYVLHHLSAV